MKISELAEAWQRDALGEQPVQHYTVSLPLEEAAKIEALVELFPRRNREQLITELVSAALDDVISLLPYEQGDTVIARDDMGDPIFEDVGLTPRFLQLVREHREQLKKEKNNGAEGGA